MNKVIDIRGPNGSGKTTAARTLIAQAQTVNFLRGPVYDDEARPYDVWALELRAEQWDRPVYLVGPYDEAPTGGCDRIKRQDTITGRIRYLARYGHVVFEGVITSTIFSRYGDLAKELAEAGVASYTVLSLDTPMAVCLDRIRARREARGSDVDDFKVDLVEDKAKAVASAMAKFREAGIEVVEGGVEQLLALLGEAQGTLAL